MCVCVCVFISQLQVICFIGLVVRFNALKDWMGLVFQTMITFSLSLELVLLKLQYDV